MTSGRPLLIALVLGLAVAGCSGSDDDTTAPAATTDGTTDDTTTADLASGSGCTPPPGDGLPDGRWYGYVDADEGDGGSDPLSFDLACWFTGEAATVAAREDGEESPPPNDYHIRNDNDRRRSLAVDPAAEVLWLTNPGDPATAEAIPLADWRSRRFDRAWTPGVWIDIAGGLVVAVEEQYVP